MRQECITNYTLICQDLFEAVGVSTYQQHFSSSKQQSKHREELFHIKLQHIQQGSAIQAGQL